MTDMTRDEIKALFAQDSMAASLNLPVPDLRLDFRMSVDLNPKIELGDGPWGRRNWISFTGGIWKASWGSGTVEVHTSIPSFIPSCSFAFAHNTRSFAQYVSSLSKFILTITYDI
jgi:hypothetical protein